MASAASLAAAVDEVVGLVSDTDLLITPLALQFCLTLLPQQPQHAAQISAKFLPAALQLARSPLLQDCHRFPPSSPHVILDPIPMRVWPSVLMVMCRTVEDLREMFVLAGVVLH